ncbi:ABC transporter permease [Sinimarinibacterium sp. CAU 1509]|uniref:ABC transporter permease n=1 Tax=Sinimarinibacterium sp. CAU 1509 TaxID=2562283 RepID=UPI0010AC0430|nr:ABC transporter permease [Sinimarinibacterium sp. CAU 1509]TJY63015.1 ABC transporter permease [Sinimarinibacterium sp. CAU 1509]
MSVLTHKLVRDLWRLRGQALAIALVVASGVTTFVIAHSTMRSLSLTQREFYRDSRFADAFASLTRAPRALEMQMAQIDGVDIVETRASGSALIDLAGFDEPVAAQILSLPNPHGGLNRLYLRAGRLPESDREVAVNEAFAEAHQLRPGDRFDLTLRGVQRRVTVTGIALSAEFVYLIRPGDIFPDYKRYGVLWMARKPLEAAEGLDGAFNDVLLRLQPGADVPAVINALDRLLAPYGSAGAIDRSDQLSHRYLSDEIHQWEVQATVLPGIFLGVAAFLLNVVMMRLLKQERSQVAVLKAFGYSASEIAMHYLMLAGVIVLLGSVFGVGVGGWLGAGMSRVYQEFFRYPYLHYVLDLDVAVSGVLVSALAALLGAALAVLRAARLPPAQGMRPEAPPRYRITVFETSRIRRWLSPGARMVVRNLLRQPIKASLTVLGIAFSAAILVVGGLMKDSIDVLLDVQFRQAMRADLTLSFDDVKHERVRHLLAAMPGVHRVEVTRAVPVRLRSGHRSERSAIQGFEPDARLYRLLDSDGNPVPIPRDGLLLTAILAQKLGVAAGDTVEVEVLTGERQIRYVPVVGVTHELIGSGGYMDRSALNRLLNEGDVVTGAFLGVEHSQLPALFTQIKRTPHIVGLMNREVAIRSFTETMAGNILIFAAVMLVLASTIAVGVVYNSMRVTFSERARELASLRVLGYTRTETGVVLLGEIVTLTLIAIPLGWAIGWLLCSLMVAELASDLYRIPLVLAPQTYAYAALVILVTTLLSSLLMTRSIKRLDLVSALKVPQ